MVAGPIAIAYNVDGVEDLVLNAEVAAKIFSGTITTWDDPAIAALNPDAKLPSTPISVFFRTGTSGTTENFTKYLHAAAPDAWTAEGNQEWAGKGEGREGSAGVAQAVAGAPGGITYVEWSFAQDNQLSVAQIDNGSGAVELTGESAGKTVATATQAGTGNDLSLKIDYATKEAGAYPIVLVTYEIVCSKGLDAEKTALLKSFLTYFAADDTQKGLADIGYAPLPDRGLHEGPHRDRGHRLTLRASAGPRGGHQHDRCPPPPVRLPTPHAQCRSTMSSITGRSAVEQGPGPSGDQAQRGASAGDGSATPSSAAEPDWPASSSSRSSPSPASSSPSAPSRRVLDDKVELPDLHRVAGHPGRPALRHPADPLDDDRPSRHRDDHRGAARASPTRSSSPSTPRGGWPAPPRASSTCWPRSPRSSTACGASRSSPRT